MRVIEITITGVVPDDESDTGHEAVYRTREPAAAIVSQLEDLGITEVKQTRRLIQAKRQVAKTREPEPEAPTV